MTRTRAASVGRLLCLTGAATGALGLSAWVAGMPFLTALVAGQPWMVPNTALGLLLIGVAGALRNREGVRGLRRMLSILAALVVLALGVGTLAEYALQTDAHIDRFLLQIFRREDTQGPYPGRSSPPTALALALLSAALLLFDFRPRARARPSEWFALSAFFAAFTALVGFAYGAGALYRLGGAPVTGVAMPTAVGLLLISAGLLLERPHAGIVRVVTSPGPGGIMLRRLAMLAILAPTLLGPLVTRLMTAIGLQDVPVVLATLSISMTAVTLVLLTITAMPLNRTHEVLEVSRTRIRDLVEQAPEGIFVADIDGRYTDVNGAGCRMLGYSREEIVGKTIVDFIPSAEVERLEQEKLKLLGGDTVVSEWKLRRKDGTYLPVEVSARILADGRWQGFVRDMSEHKRAQEQLRQTQERFELALRGADLAAWDWNVRTGEVIFNPRWAEMRGFQPDQIKPHVDSWVTTVHPEDWPRIQKALSDHFQGLIPECETEHRVRTRSGEWLWVLDRGKVFARDEQGQPLRMVGTELDITQRKRLEEDLRLSLAQFSGILSISADAIISIDESQRITMFNEGAEKIFGCSKAEAIGTALERWIPERFRAIHRQHVNRFAASGEVSRRMGEPGMAIFAQRKNGEEFPADAAISKLDVGGRIILTVALRDITEQKRTEREEQYLSEVASALSSTLDYEETLKNVARVALGELADVCIVEAVEDGRLLPRLQVAHRDPGMAAAAEALRKRSLDGRRCRLGLSVFDTGEPLVMSEVTPDYLESVAIDDEHRRALHELGPESLLALPLLAHGRLLGSMVLISTNPARRFGPGDLPLAMEVARRASWAVENARLYRTALHATEARDQLLGVVAHDLRNPLGAILMQAALLRRFGARLEPRLLEPLEGIEHAATRMSRLINDLLDLTSIEAGHLSVERERVPADELLRDCLKTQEPLASAASLELRLQVEEGIPEVSGDRDRLLQVLENLIGNAIKFSSPGGCIIIGATRGAEEVRFWVTSSGAAIPPEHLPRLFDRFWQARKTERRGAGLGLPIVKGIVEAHGGRVWAESAEGRGNTFTFTIPLAQGATTVRSAQTQGP